MSGTLVESVTIPKPKQRRKANIEEIRRLCAALFIRAEDSYSGFWMRAICLCALRLGLSISVFGSSLSDSTGAYTEVMRSENLLRWAVERQFDDQWTVKNDHFIPAFEESVRADVLKESFLRLSTTFSANSLPGLYKKFMREITDLMV